tara:strand:+ start:488 stop:619 length:132 start_codon:yes stop_codon:yes gene_type:complete
MVAPTDPGIGQQAALPVFGIAFLPASPESRELSGKQRVKSGGR